jgi:hypothetical protein
MANLLHLVASTGKLNNVDIVRAGNKIGFTRLVLQHDIESVTDSCGGCGGFAKKQHNRAPSTNNQMCALAIGRRHTSYVRMLKR